MPGDATERLVDALSLTVHDLGEPLREIRGYAELLERRVASGLAPEDEALLAHVLAGARRMDAMIAGLGEYIAAERAPMAPERLDLSELLGGRDTPVELGELVPVRGDRALVETLLSRLVDNASTFGGAGGRIVVTARREGDRAIVEVADDGPGVPAGDEARVTRLFQRAHPRDEFAGAGVGLAVAAAIVARHGGALSISRREGGGSIVRLSLPAA